MICPRCHTLISDQDARFCPQCSTSLVTTQHDETQMLLNDAETVRKTQAPPAPPEWDRRKHATSSSFDTIMNGGTYTSAQAAKGRGPSKWLWVGVGGGIIVLLLLSILAGTYINNFITLAKSTVSTTCNAVLNGNSQDVVLHFSSPAEARQFLAKEQELNRQFGPLQSINITSVSPETLNTATGTAIYHYQQKDINFTFHLIKDQSGEILIDRYSIT
ncbi:MAG: hypothetical protein NVS4B9_19940 [Ktedonobacteraceae bacterium]